MTGTPARVGDLEEDVDDLAVPHEHGVGPDKVGVLDAVATEYQRPAPWMWNGWCIGWSSGR